LEQDNCFLMKSFLKFLMLVYSGGFKYIMKA
jgi:hypothetical protein